MKIIDTDGFYDWLDENIFVTTEENSESVENELPAAQLVHAKIK